MADVLPRMSLAAAERLFFDFVMLVARGVHLEMAVKCIWDETLLISAKVAAIEIYIFTIQTITRGLNEAPLIV